MYHNGYWGTICGTGFSKVVADVICKTFGHTNGAPLHQAAFGKAQSIMWIHEVHCSHFDYDLNNCNIIWGGYCSNHNPATVVCYNGKSLLLLELNCIYVCIILKS